MRRPFVHLSGLAGAPVPFVPVTGLSLAGGPPLVLKIEEDGAQEFRLVGNGTLAGSADGLFDFEARIVGSLDCTTKKCTGTLSGSAKDVLGVFIQQVFVGTMTADYDADAKAFENGAWDLMSRDANAGDGGPTLGAVDVTGSGNWNGSSDAGALRDGAP